MLYGGYRDWTFAYGGGITGIGDMSIIGGDDSPIFCMIKRYPCVLRGRQDGYGDILACVQPDPLGHDRILNGMLKYVHLWLLSFYDDYW